MSDNETVAIGIALMGFLVLPTILFFAYATFDRILRYRETKILAKHGLVRPMQRRRRGRGRSRRGSIITTGVGIALTLSLWPIGFFVDDSLLGLGPWMLPGLIPLFVGLAMIYADRADDDDPDDEMAYLDDEFPPSNKMGQ